LKLLQKRQIFIQIILTHSIPALPGKLKLTKTRTAPFYKKRINQVFDCIVRNYQIIIWAENKAKICESADKRSWILTGFLEALLVKNITQVL